MKPLHKYLIHVLGFLFFGTLLWLAVLYYKERMLSWDPAFFAFGMIQENGFSIPLGRWGNVITQLLPWIALKSGCSLKTLLIVYSISPILIAWAVFYVITLVLDRYKVALAMMLGLCLTFRLTFYYNVTELTAVITFTFLLWALLTDTPVITKGRMLFCMALVIVMSYYHQLAVFPVLFVFLLELMIKEKVWRRPVYLLFAFSLIWFAIRIFWLTRSDYENDKIPSLPVFFEQLPNIFNLPSTVHLKEFMRYQAWPWFLVLGAGLAAALWKRKWLPALLLVCFAFGFTALILVTYHKGESTLAYEQYYTVLGVFPSVFLLAMAWGRVRLLWILLLVMPVLVRCVKSIHSSHFIITERISYIDRLVKQGRKLENKKYVIHPSTLNRNVTDATWALAFETLLYSSLEHPDSALTFYCLEGDYDQHDSIMTDPNLFMGYPGSFGWFDIKGLKKEYFNLPGNTTYIKTTTFQPMSDTLPAHDQLGIVPARDTIYSHALVYVIAPVEVTNRSGKTLHALSPLGFPPVMTCRIYDKSGKQVLPEQVKTPLEQDILTSYTQGVTVHHYLQKGEYDIEFILERKGSLDVVGEKRMKLMVR